MARSQKYINIEYNIAMGSIGSCTVGIVGLQNSLTLGVGTLGVGKTYPYISILVHS